MCNRIFHVFKGAGNEDIISAKRSRLDQSADENVQVTVGKRARNTSIYK